MSIDAVALLKGKDLALPEDLQSTSLDDATLVDTGLDLSSSELAIELSETLGEALDAHDDARGVFVMPAKVQPKARSYQAVIDEVGELGMWVEKVEAPMMMPDMSALGSGAFGALMGELMQAIDPATMADMQRALEGDAAAMARVQAKMTEALGGEEAIAARSDELLRAAQEGAAALGGQIDMDALAKQAKKDDENQ
ncbi:MAG TPA: hypothetical protein VFB62_07890 [Polyangiaceae bacterium]|jgi:hypothetical protein|nr:hypothetical protein [Polyangiaceae bacterium]